MNENQILELKQQMEDAKSKTLQLKGQLKGLMNQLKELGFKSVEAAQTALKVKQKEIKDIDALIEEKTAELEKYF